MKQFRRRDLLSTRRASRRGGSKSKAPLPRSLLPVNDMVQTISVQTGDNKHPTCTSATYLHAAPDSKSTTQSVVGGDGDESPQTGDLQYIFKNCTANGELTYTGHARAGAIRHFNIDVLLKVARVLHRSTAGLGSATVKDGSTADHLGQSIYAAPAQL